jgi:hypothetical protein
MKKASSVKLWLFVGAGFVLLIMAYVFVFKAAHAAQIREVAPAAKGTKP